MADYKHYTGVEKLQEYLEGQRSDGKISGPSLKESDGSFDGKYGPITDGAFQEWSNGWASSVEGSMAIGAYGVTITPLEWLGTQGVLTAAEIAQVKIAYSEYTKGGVDASSKPPASTGIVQQTDYVPPPAAPKKWGTTQWVVAGVVAGVAGLLAWNWYKNRKPSRRAAFAPVRGLSCGCGK